MTQGFAKTRNEAPESIPRSGSSYGSDGQALISAAESLEAVRKRIKDRNEAPSASGVALIEAVLGFRNA